MATLVPVRIPGVLQLQPIPRQGLPRRRPHPLPGRAPGHGAIIGGFEEIGALVFLPMIVNGVMTVSQLENEVLQIRLPQPVRHHPVL